MLDIYKTRFQVKSKFSEASSHVAEECIAFVDRWIAGSYARARAEYNEMLSVEEFDRNSERPQIRRNTLGCGAFNHSLFWGKQDPRRRGTRWITLVDLVSDGEQLEFQLHLGMEADAVALEAAKPSTGRPRVIATLLSHPKWDCIVGDQVLSALGQTLIFSDIERFCDDVLYSDGREIPIIVVTPIRQGKTFQSPVDIKILADRLGGTAKVFQVRDRLATEVLDQYLGKNLAIGQDAIRVFAPRLKPGSTLSGHWHFLGETIKLKKLSSHAFSDFLFSKLAERALVSFRESDLLRVFRQKASQERSAKLAALKHQGSADREYYEEYAKELERQNADLKQENKDLRERLQDKDEQAISLRRELERSEANIALLSRELGKPELDFAEPLAAEERSRLVVEIVEEAAQKYSGLIVLRSATRSARDVPETYEFPDRVEKALLCLNDGGHERGRTGRMEGGWRNFFASRGFEYKNLSDTAKSRWSDDYHFLYKGKHELFEEHFTIGVKSANTCLSIHFSTRLHRDKIVLAYVGRHLRNTQS